MHEKYVRDLLFADDAAITTDTQEDLQRLLDRFSDACRHFGLTISLAKTQVMGQDIKEIPSFFIHNYKLEVVHEFVYLGSTITDNLSIDSELNKRIGKAAMTLSRLTKRVWSNNKFSDHTKVNVHKACAISTLLYGSESCTMRAHQEKRLNVFHMNCLRRILGITWQDKVTNKVVLEKAGIPSFYTLLKQRHMGLLGHVTRMKDGRIPKDLYMANWRQGKDQQDDPNYASRTYASETSRHLA